MDATPTLYTERLIQRPLELADAEAIQQQFPRAAVTEYWFQTLGRQVLRVPKAAPNIAREEWLEQR